MTMERLTVNVLNPIDEIEFKIQELEMGDVTAQLVDYLNIQIPKVKDIYIREFENKTGYTISTVLNVLLYRCQEDIFTDYVELINNLQKLNSLDLRLGVIQRKYNL